MLELFVLGSGASVPSPQRNLPGFALRFDGDILLFDCGEGTQRQMMKCGVSYARVKAVFITHGHLDHWLGLLGLLETLRLNERKEKMRVFAPGWLAKWLGITRYEFLEFTPLEEGEMLREECYAVSAFPVKHGNTESFGLVFQEAEKRRFHEAKAKGLGVKGRLFTEIQEKGKLVINGKTIKLEDVTYLQPGKKLVYTGDTVPCPAIVKHAKNADLLVHEATFSSEHSTEAKERKHSTASDAATAAKKAKVKKLLLAHISARYHDAGPLLDEARKVFPDTSVAEDGQVINV